MDGDGLKSWQGSARTKNALVVGQRILHETCLTGFASGSAWRMALSPDFFVCGIEPGTMSGAVCVLFSTGQKTRIFTTFRSSSILKSNDIATSVKVVISPALIPRTIIARIPADILRVHL